MKTSKKLAWRRAALVFGCAVLVTPAALQAQAVATPVRATEPPKDEKEKTVVLTPFEVSTAKDEGFVATSSLAGGRLATDMNDTPVAYTVITRDFIDALGITDLDHAMQWMPNVVSSVNAQGTNNDISGQPIGTVNVRGSAGGSTNSRQQRNYFIYFAPMDSYSLERYDIGRGPNSILFGNSSLGGVTSATTKQARFDQPFVSVSQMVGSWSKFRTEIDVNKPLNDKLAVRAAGVYADRKGYQYKEFEKNRAAFLTGTYKFSKVTTLRLEGEYGEWQRTTPLTNINDKLSGWDGISTFSGRLDTLPADANARGISRRPANYNVYIPGTGKVMNYENDPITMGGGVTATTPIGPYTFGAL